jgi:hypothetical protein
VTDFLDEKRQEISKRLEELKPLVDEYDRLEAAASALAGVGQSNAQDEASAAIRARPRRAGRPPGAPRKKASPSAGAGVSPKRGRERRKRVSPRAAQALALVQERPGITIPELAGRMGIKQNYLYRVLPGLEQEKAVEKQGRGWHPATRAVAVSDELQAIFPGDEVWCPRHMRYHSPPAHK